MFSVQPEEIHNKTRLKKAKTAITPWWIDVELQINALISTKNFERSMMPSLRLEQGECASSNHLCQFWSLPSEVEYVLLLAKVLDHNLETVWPGADDKQRTGLRPKQLGGVAFQQPPPAELTCQTDCRARRTRSTHSGQSALWVWLLSSRSQSRWAGRQFPPGWSRGSSTACLCLWKAEQNPV